MTPAENPFTRATFDAVAPEAVEALEQTELIQSRLWLLRELLGILGKEAKGEGAVEVLRRLVASNARSAELEAALRAALPELEYQSYRINDEICDFHRADAGLDDVCICDEQARRSAVVDQVRKALAAPEGEK